MLRLTSLYIVHICTKKTLMLNPSIIKTRNANNLTLPFSRLNVSQQAAEYQGKKSLNKFISMGGDTKNVNVFKR